MPVTRQILKLFHLVFEVTALVVYYLPQWFVSGSQIWLWEERKGNWTLRRHLCVQMMRHNVFVLQERAGILPPPTPDHTVVEGLGGIWVPPAPPDLVVGEIGALVRDRDIALIPIPGYWIHKHKEQPLESRPSPGEKILYHFHGGGYVIGTAHPDGIVSGRIPKEFLQNSSSPSLRRTFSVEYRLSKPGEPGEGPLFPFPTALVDALAGYLYLIKIGFSEEDIILVGDSAGANLALALTRYLLSNKGIQPELPKIPAALVLISPWTDMSQQFLDNPGTHSSQIKNAQRDWLSPLNRGFLHEAAKAFLGGLPEHIESAYRDPYISPASPILLGLTSDSATRTISFEKFPRTFIVNGRFETFYDQILRLGNAMVEDLGEDSVAYYEVDGATHDYMIFDWTFGPDRTSTSKKILKWLGL